MKLTAKPVPYSSVVGGGLMLHFPTGAAAFQLVLMGTTRGISRAQTEAITARLQALINLHGIEVPEAPPLSDTQPETK